MGDENYHVTSVPVEVVTGALTLRCNVELGVIRRKEDEPDVVADEDENAASFLYTHDPLTGLLNTEGFFRAARQELIENSDETYVILVANLRQFKLYNAMYGRACGDGILSRLGDLLKEERINDSHSIIGRGHSSGFLLMKRKRDYSEDRLRKTLDRFRSDFSTKGFLFNMHVGVYEITEPDLPLSVMVDRAVMAMRTLRVSSERDIAYFDSDMLADVIHEYRIISRFDRFMEDGRFRMYLQPQVDSEGNMIGAEALVRAFDIDGSMVAPDEFIGVLERSEQISRLDLFIWESAVKKLAGWAEDPYLKKAYISVNVSPRDLYVLDVPGTLKELTDRYGVPADRLRVEITETSVMKDLNERADNISRLQDYGFTVEIDDFGKGESSLALLSRSNAEVLKIDKEFLREARMSKKSLQVLKAVIALSSAIGMVPIVEGVETEEQVELLKEMGCGVYQGFYFGKPMPVDEFEREFGRKA